MKRSATIRFESVLAASERENAARTLRSAGACVTSWSDAAGTTYGALYLEPQARLENVAAAGRGGRVDVPPLTVLRVTPAAGDRLPALAAALGGVGRPRGVAAVRPDERSLVVELHAQTTPLALLLALVDAELTFFPGRTIEPLLPLDDATLTAFARDLLAEPDLDAGRLVETYLDPLLAPANRGHA